jgi:hypothetical protein
MICQLGVLDTRGKSSKKEVFRPISGQFEERYDEEWQGEKRRVGLV